MSDSRAFTKVINPIGSGTGEYNSIHQVSPAWVLTFVRWENRDAIRTPKISPIAIRDLLVVENDCLSVTTTCKKGALTPSMSAVLVMTDINYETEVAPGDFVMVNMLNWGKDARRVANASRAKQPINGENDGFKGVFKVQSVRRIVMSDPTTGTNSVLFKIDGFAFTEFNNAIYFNPYLLDPSQDKENQLLFSTFVGTDWKLLVNKKGFVNVQDIIAVLIQSLIGNGISAEGRVGKMGSLQSPNVHFFMPSLVGSLLGVKGVKAAKDIYNYLFGIQTYAGGFSASLSVGMNPAPKLNNVFGRFYYTDIACEGSTILKPEYWNNVKTWSILNQYTNSPLNELYTCFRISPTGNVMPTLVFRQIPFTNEDYKTTFKKHSNSVPGSTPVTRFLTVPRWKIHPSLIIEQDLGREEAARINFVQYFGRSNLGVEGADMTAETAQKNYLYDVDDVQRSGLRPYIVTTQFDDPTTKDKNFHSPIWARILGDCLIGGHLKLNGTFRTAGIVDPIAIGDNLEFDGVVYHIEQVVHTCNYDPGEGKRMFRTSISLSNGISTSSSENGTRYSEMNLTQASDLRTRDSKNNGILPGVSESQDVVYRTNNPDVNDKPAFSNPFPQPNTKQGGQNDNGSDK